MERERRIIVDVWDATVRGNVVHLRPVLPDLQAEKPAQKIEAAQAPIAGDPIHSRSGGCPSMKLVSEVRAEAVAAASCSAVGGMQSETLSARPATGELDVEAELAAMRFRGRSQLAWRVAAAVLALALLLPLITLLHANAPFEQEFVTAASEWRIVRLDDGSQLRLAPRSKVTVAMQGETRATHLDSGEAYFDVARNASWPFIVSTDRASARVLGTRFAVAREHDRTVVTVAEGLVRVSKVAEQIDEQRGAATRSAAQAQAGVTVGAGEQIVVHDRHDMQVEQVDTSAELAWLEGVVEFRNRTLGEAVAVFNRYNIEQIEILDPQVAARRVNGRFRADDPIAFVNALQKDGTFVTAGGAPSVRIVGVAKSRRMRDGLR